MNSSLKSIPAIILTTASAETDIIKVYDLNANAYIVKPIDFDEFMKVIRSIEDFWLKVITLPPKKDQKLNSNDSIMHISCKICSSPLNILF